MFKFHNGSFYETGPTEKIIRSNWIPTLSKKICEGLSQAHPNGFHLLSTNSRQNINLLHLAYPAHALRYSVPCSISLPVSLFLHIFF